MMPNVYGMLQQMMPNFSGLLNQLKLNPMQFLMQKKMQIPQGFAMNDPDAILNHLLQTGQISQQQINNAYQMAQQYRR